MLGPNATDFSMRNNLSGELGGLNQDYARARMMAPAAGAQMATPAGATPAARNGNGSKKHAWWWLTFAITFVIVAWAARKYAPDGEQFAIVKPNLINGVFLTLWLVLILVFLKQVAIRVKNIPLIKELAELVLSV
jgi:hypothetical protein